MVLFFFLPKVSSLAIWTHPVLVDVRVCVSMSSVKYTIAVAAGPTVVIPTVKMVAETKVIIMIFHFFCFWCYCRIHHIIIVHRWDEHHVFDRWEFEWWWWPTWTAAPGRRRPTTMECLPPTLRCRRWWQCSESHRQQSLSVDRLRTTTLGRNFCGFGTSGDTSHLPPIIMVTSSLTMVTVMMLLLMVASQQLVIVVMMMMMIVVMIMMLVYRRHRTTFCVRERHRTNMWWRRQRRYWSRWRWRSHQNIVVVAVAVVVARSTSTAGAHADGVHVTDVHSSTVIFKRRERWNRIVTDDMNSDIIILMNTIILIIIVVCCCCDGLLLDGVHQIYHVVMESHVVNVHGQFSHLSEITCDKKEDWCCLLLWLISSNGSEKIIMTAVVSISPTSSWILMIGVVLLSAIPCFSFRFVSLRCCAVGYGVRCELTRNVGLDDR